MHTWDGWVAALGDRYRTVRFDLPAYGLKPAIITDDFPQEVFLRACAVLSEKVGRGN